VAGSSTADKLDVDNPFGLSFGVLEKLAELWCDHRRTLGQLPQIEAAAAAERLDCALFFL